MEVLIQILTFVLIISILVILHELGHFIPAKLFKTKVEKFYLFFDPWFSIIKKKVGETTYGIGWLPLGGYVKIAGMIDESMDKEQMAKPPQPWEFRSKPAWQRLIIMLGGIIVNVLLAWAIYTTLFVVNGDEYIPINSLKHGIYVDQNGEKLGLKTGDRIISVDGKEIKKFRKSYMDLLLGDEAVVDRNGKKITIELTDEGKKAVLESKGERFLELRQEAIIGVIANGYSASKSDLKVDDKVISINGESIQFWDQLDNKIKNSKNTTLNLMVERGDLTMPVNLIIPDSSIVGIISSNKALRKLAVKEDYSITKAIPAGFKKTFTVLSEQIKQFKLIFNRKVQGYKQVKGPIGIVEMMPSKWNWSFFWGFMAMFSIWLAFINLLPIPALDGGHAMFLIYEMVSGKAPSEKVLERGQIAGFLIIMSIMVLVFGNDIWNIIKRFI